MNSNAARVAEFHEHLSYGDTSLAITLVKEEVKELLEAVADGNKENILKEASDAKYVIDRLLLQQGFTPYTIIEAEVRVHKSNMSKFGEDGRPIFREDGKVLKGPNYKPPALKDLVP